MGERDSTLEVPYTCKGRHSVFNVSVTLYDTMPIVLIKPHTSQHEHPCCCVALYDPMIKFVNLLAVPDLIEQCNLHT